MIGPDGLTFEFSNIAVNGQVGGTLLKIIETITLNNHSQTNSTSFTLSKFPQTFDVQSFTAQPTSIAPGGTVTLSWNGSSSDSNNTYAYSLSYCSTNVSDLESVGTYPVYGLQASTEFTLNVEAGGNALCQKQVYVTVEQPTITQFGIVGSNSNFVVQNGTIEFCWQTENVDHCALSLNGTPISGAISLPANSISYSVTCPTAFKECEFTLTAFSGKTNNGGVTSSTFIYVLQFIVSPHPLTLPGDGDQEISVSPDGSHIAIVCGLRSIALVSTAQNQITNTLAYATLLHPIFNSDGTQIHCVQWTGGGLYSTESYVNSYSLSGQQISQSAVGFYLAIVAGTAPGSMIVAALSTGADDFNLSSFAVLDPSNLSLVKSLDFPGGKVTSLAVNPQGDLVLCCSGYRIYRYQVGNNTVSWVFSSGRLSSPVFSPDGDRYFFAVQTFDGSSEEYTISVVNTADNSVIGQIPLPAPVIDNSELDIIETPVYTSPMVAAPDKVNFFAVLSNNTIAWIRLDIMQVIQCLQVGTSPCAIAMNSTGTKLYVTDTQYLSESCKLWTVEIPSPT